MILYAARRLALAVPLLVGMGVLERGAPVRKRWGGLGEERRSLPPSSK